MPPPSSEPRVSSRTRILLAVLTAVLVPLAALTVYAILTSRAALKEEIYRTAAAKARGAALVAQEDLTGKLEAMDLFAGRPAMREAFIRRDQAGVQRHLRDLVRTIPAFQRAFVTDPEGTEWADFPHDPAVIGKSFAHREWYRGALTRPKPYLSGTYERAARPIRWIYAFAAPVLDEQQRLVGIVAAQDTGDLLREKFERLHVVEGGGIALVDHNGRLVFQVGVQIFEDRADVLGHPHVARALRGEERFEEISHPDRGDLVAIYTPVRKLGWAVVSHVPLTYVTAPVRSLIFQTAAVGLLLILIVGYLAFRGAAVYARNRELLAEADRLNRELTERQRELEEANEELQAHRTDLEDKQAELEQQTIELETQQEEVLRVNRELEERAERLRTLVVSGHRLLGGLSLREERVEVLRQIVDESRLLLGARYAALGIFDDEGRLAEFHTSGITAEERARIGDLPRGHGILGLLVREAHPLRLADLTRHPSSVGFPPHHPPMKSFLGVPIRFGERVLGRLYFTEKEGVPEFTQEDEDRAQVFAALAAVAVENARVYHLLQEERNRYWAVLNSSSDGLALADPDRTLLFVNRFFNPYFGIERVERFVGRSVEDLCRQMAPLLKDPDRCLSEMDRLWTDPGAASDLDVEMRDGRVFHLHSGPVRNSSEAVIGRYLVFRDVTREKEIDRMKSEFVATVSHEIRTPLSSLLGFSELMLQRDLPEEKRRQFLGIIHAETRRLTDLINDFLNLQRIEAGMVAYDLRPLEIGEVLREAAALLSEESRHPLRLEIADGLPSVTADRDRIKQVLQNLLSNAVKFSPQGGEVTLSARATGEGEVEIAVRDRGLGIPAEAMPRLFTKFFRVEASDRQAIGGTGLGLALCKEIVEAHGGRIRAESRPGEGSTFSFTLRAEPAAPDPAQVRATPETLFVLVVENNRPFAALVREHLEGEGYAVRVEETAEAALTAVRTTTPRLILLDIHLVGPMDGWDFLAAVKSDPRTAEIPVIITTITDRQAKGMALGASDYLIKPFGMGRLLRAVRRFLPAPEEAAVLVVDDDAGFRSELVESLRVILRCRVDEAGSGEEALEKIRFAAPQLVILDLLLPGIDGFAVLDTLRTGKSSSKVPVLVVTGKTLTSGEKARLNDGIVRVLTKEEYSKARLLALMREVWGSRRAASA